LGLNADNSQIYTISFFPVWSTLIFCLLDSKHPVWYPYHGSWLLALLLEIGLFSLSLTIRRLSSPFDYTLLIIQISRLLALSLLVACIFETFSKVALHTSGDESAPLLSQMDRPSGHVDLSNTAYGSAATETLSDGADLEGGRAKTRYRKSPKGKRKLGYLRSRVLHFYSIRLAF